MPIVLKITLKAKEYLTETINHWETWREQHTSATPANCGNVDPPTPLIGVIYVKRHHVKMYKQTASHTFCLLGKCLFHETLFEEALQKYEKAVEIAKEITDDETIDPTIARFLMNMGKCHLLCQSTNEALNFFTDGANILKNNGDQAFAENIADCNRIMKQCENFAQNFPQTSTECSSKNSDSYFCRVSSITLFSSHDSSESYHKEEATKKRQSLRTWLLCNQCFREHTIKINVICFVGISSCFLYLVFRRITRLISFAGVKSYFSHELSQYFCVKAA